MSTDTTVGADDPAPIEPIDGAAPESANPTPVTAGKASGSKLKRFLRAYWRKKRWTIPLTVVGLLAVVLLVPLTRYPALGLFLKQDFTVTVVDQSSGKPVTRATVDVAGKSAQTDAKGQAKLHVKVGKANLTVTKKYYKTTSSSVLVGLSSKSTAYTARITATGRQVPVTVVNKITGKPVSGVLLAAAGSEAKTDKDGKATIVLPANKATADVKISSSGFNAQTATIKVSEQVLPENKFAVVPTGKIYFLSKLSGKIDVAKTNLDGSERQTVLAGTGKEDNIDTVLLASRDWKYLALKSKRDGGENAKLFLIDTSTDKLTTMDEGKASFTIAGWADHRFLYTVDREGIQAWQLKAQALKSYDAITGKITVIDETSGEGVNSYDYASNRINNVYILDNELFYTKIWFASTPARANGKLGAILSVKPDGSARRSLKDFPADQPVNIDVRLYKPLELVIRVGENGNSKISYFEYEDGKVVAAQELTDATFYDNYPRFIWSPSGKQNFWFDQRDGKNVMFVGDAEGKNEKQIASLSEYAAYGWYTDDYLLVSKKDSELYIMPVTGGDPVKVTDYHKPNFNYLGYGGGY